MKRELTPREIIYNNDFLLDESLKTKSIEKIDDVYETIEEALNIDRDGFNIYLFDSFSNKKIKEIIESVDGIMKTRKKPRDICYATLENDREPEVLIVPNSFGVKLQNYLEKIKAIYSEKIFNFYNSSISDEKEKIIDNVSRKRNDYIERLIETAKDEGFELKATESGITFIPLDEEKNKDENEEKIEISEDEFIERVTRLKDDAESTLEKLKDIEEDSLEKLKAIFREYIVEESESVKEDVIEEFEEAENIKNYILNVCESIEDRVIKIYSMEYEDDEEKIGEIIASYTVNVLVDNSKTEHPRVVFEEDPSINNLFGGIEYENNNGSYSTNVSLIKPGSILMANEGCIILRLNSLLINQGSYYYLRRALLNNRVNFDYDRGYLELLSLNGLKPKPVPINVKVIVIGDYESYDALYNGDEDFAKIFGVRAEVSQVLDITDSSKIQMKNYIDSISGKNDILNVTSEAVNEIGKYLSRKAESRSRIFWDIDEIEKILILASNHAKKNNKLEITAKEIREIAYKKTHLESEYQKMYKDKKMLVNVKDEIVGSINGLAVIDTGYLSFGKPIRITCVTYKGTGRIVDTQRESNMSGLIHNKSINILKGFLNNYLNSYETTPVDFHITFEQMYGGLDGDSASVAEIIAMLSSLSKMPIKQTIAVTGSLNQFGEVQPIGGVNQKIEGFFKTCDILDTHVGKGVLIPDTNSDELILCSEVEEAVKKGDFHIYTMKTISDAMDVLMINNNQTIEDLATAINNEINKYK